MKNLSFHLQKILQSRSSIPDSKGVILCSRCCRLVCWTVGRGSVSKCGRNEIGSDLARQVPYKGRLSVGELQEALSNQRNRAKFAAPTEFDGRDEGSAEVNYFRFTFEIRTPLTMGSTLAATQQKCALLFDILN